MEIVVFILCIAMISAFIWGIRRQFGTHRNIRQALLELREARRELLRDFNELERLLKEENDKYED